MSEPTKDAERYQQLAEGYVAADFAYPQYEGRPVLVFVLPMGSKVSANLDRTLDAARALSHSRRTAE